MIELEYCFMPSERLLVLEIFCDSFEKLYALFASARDIRRSMIKILQLESAIRSYSRCCYHTERALGIDESSSLERG